MYTAYIGRRIIDLYNEHRRDGPALSPHDFFDEVVFPVAFDDERYLFWPNNSPFAQPTYSGKRDDPDVRQRALADTYEKVAAIDEPLGHLFMGGMASGVLETTSGQVSTVGASANPDEAYCSWVGAMAGIGLKGGLSMLVDHDDVLLALLDGWFAYRSYLDQTPGLKGNQVETWNGHWICHRFGYDYRENDPLRDLKPRTTKSTGIKTQKWASVLFNLARALPGETPTVYLYSLGQMNTTVGFRQLHLPDVQRLAQLHEKLFGDVEGVSSRSLADMYDTQYSIYAACQQGTIGMRALQPDKLRDYMPGGRKDKMPTPTRSPNKQNRYRIFQTWIVAMLNNEELIDLTESTAQALKAHAESGEDTYTTEKRRAEEVLKAGHRREFLDALTAVLKEDDSHAEHFNKLADTIVKMPASDFPLFATLLRLKYTVFSK
ncbi:hypothetical protein CRI93_01310 [Longimonas halophila]|uniref:Uncharacterized protein n=1 Tax=Longimonas halophila TaxID=1469170 RepID=A0A2H3NQ48_9BACT|nr:hypothetical protein [Longimonas halophila]PEN09391.1 hypothetical protein CRI93_01310 [Longimonas halophila]